MCALGLKELLRARTLAGTAKAAHAAQARHALFGVHELIAFCAVRFWVAHCVDVMRCIFEEPVLLFEAVHHLCFAQRVTECLMTPLRMFLARS